jgi:uncharacterized protein YjbJ (UPF0337 family)
MKRTLTLAAALAAAITLPAMAISWDQVSGDWKQFEGKVQKQWGKLTNDDLLQAKGDRRILAGKIQERYGITKEEADSQVRAWLDSY